MIRHVDRITVHGDGQHHGRRGLGHPHPFPRRLQSVKKLAALLRFRSVGKRRVATRLSIAGVINAPAANKRSHWLREDGKFPKSSAEWIAGATEQRGSWWTDWSDWLKAQAGKQIAAPKTYGKGAYKAIEPAPGRYVKAKA